MNLHCLNPKMLWQINDFVWQIQTTHESDDHSYIFIGFCQPSQWVLFLHPNSNLPNRCGCTSDPKSHSPTNLSASVIKFICWGCPGCPGPPGPPFGCIGLGVKNIIILSVALAVWELVPIRWELVPAHKAF